MDCSCFNGEYVTAPNSTYFSALAGRRAANRGDVEATSSHLLDTLQITPRKEASPEMMRKP